MEKRRVDRFIIGTVVTSLCVFIFSVACLAVILCPILHINNGWSSIWLISIGNIAIYCTTNALYYWRGDRVVWNYMEERFSLRPFAYFLETAFFVLFFLIRPEIIVGYFVLKGLRGYRGERHGQPSDDKSTEQAKMTGELNAIKISGTVLQIFLSLAAAASLYVAAPQLQDLFNFLSR